MQGWATAWQQAGHQISVVTPLAQPGDAFYQNNLASPAHITVINVKALDLSRPFRTVSAPVENLNDNLTVTPPSLKRRVILLLRDWLELPDHRRIWNRAALKALRQLQKPADVIVTTSPYSSTHLVGRAYKRQHPYCLWVADFRDPWRQHWAERKHTSLHRRYNDSLERAILSECDLISAWHDVGIADMAERHGAWVKAKALAVFNGVAAETRARLLATPLQANALPFRLVYAGTTWDWLLPPNFATSWSIFAQNVGRPVELVLWGRVEAGARRALAQANTTAPVRLCGSTDAAGVAEALATSQAIVIFAGPYADNVSSKIFECIAARRPILYLGHPQSPGASLLRQVGATKSPAPSFDQAGSDAAFAALAQAIRDNNFSGLIPTNDPPATDRREQALKLLTAIEQTKQRLALAAASSVRTYTHPKSSVQQRAQQIAEPP